MNSFENLASTLRLYAVTPCECTEVSVRAVLAGGATFLQLREKDLGHEEFLAKARAMRALCPANVPYVINDDIDIALACDADGAHIGQSDGSVAEARRKLGPDRILGVSAQTVAEAIAAERDGADYLGVGAVFPSSTKLDAVDVSADTLHAICASVRIPVVAIGGIGEANLMQLAGSGIAGVAVVSALFGSADPMAATRRLDAATRALVAVPTAARRGAIIDLDGTVLDSMGVWEDLDRRFVAEHRFANPDEVLHHLTTVVHLSEASVYLHEECGVPESPEEIEALFHRWLSERYYNDIPVFPWTRPALERLRAEGVCTALATATCEELSMAALRRNGVADLIDSFYFNVTKREPETLYAILDKLGTGTRETTVYDDIDSILSMAARGGFATADSLRGLVEP